MSNISPVSIEALPNQDEFAGIVGIMGFVSNSLRTMAHRPNILKAFSALNVAIFSESKIDLELKYILGYVASAVGGCRYCQAHTSFLAKECGVPAEKLSQAFLSEDSPNYTLAERAAIRLAMHAAMAPSAVTSDDFRNVRQYFDESEVVEILCIVGLFAFLNRWNDSLATELEGAPRQHAEQNLTQHGWQLGKHSADHTREGGKKP